FKITHPYPLRPGIADDNNIAVVVGDIRIALEKVVVRPRGLQPIIAASIIWNSELSHTLGQRDHVLLEVSGLIAAIEKNGREFHRRLLCKPQASEESPVEWDIPFSVGQMPLVS